MSKFVRRGLAMLLVMALLVAPVNATPAPTTDSNNTPHLVAIEYLTEVGILQGLPLDAFESEITRAEFIALVMTAFSDRLEGIPTRNVVFSDIGTHWARNYIITAANHGFISGFDDGRFLPDEKITYEQAFTIIVRIVGRAQNRFPVGYLTFAMREGMADNIPIVTGENITRGEVAQIIFNVISRERFEEAEREAMAALQRLGQQSPDLLYDLNTGRLLRQPTRPSPQPRTRDMFDVVIKSQASAGSAGGHISQSVPPSAPMPAPSAPMSPGMMPPPPPGGGAMRAQSTDRNQHLTSPESGFLSPISSPLSTFSLDVNTAAYSFIRRSLHQGRLPNRSVVRIEEMINYFSYDLPRPTDGETFTVTTEVQRTPWNEDTYLAMIALQGYDIAREDLPPSNLVFLIDVSGSMFPRDRLPLAQRALSLLVDQLRPIDTVTIVTYASGSRIVLEATPGDQRDVINQAIFSLRSGGATAGSYGILLAYEQARLNFKEGGNNRIILCTDGDFNVGLTSLSQLEDLVIEQRESGVFLSVLGFGYGNLRDDFLETLARHGNGNYAYIDNLNEAKRVLVDDMVSTIFTIASDVRLQVEFNPETVYRYRLIGYERRMLADEAFDLDDTDAGEMGAGHSMIAFYEIIPRRHGDVMSPELRYQTMQTTGSDELFVVHLRYNRPVSGEPVRPPSVVVPGLTAAPPSETFNFASAVVEWAMILADSEHLANANLDNVLSRARTNRGDDTFGHRAEFVQLVDLSRLLFRAYSHNR